MTLVDFVGYTPPRSSSKGGPDRPLLAPAPLAPIPCPKKNQKCVRARHGLRVSCQGVRIEFGSFRASAGTFRAHVFSVLPNDQGDRGGYTPFLTISAVLKLRKYDTSAVHNLSHLRKS